MPCRCWKFITCVWCARSRKKAALRARRRGCTSRSRRFSHQLAELEGRLGVVLFSRVRRQLKLTPAGARLVEAARVMLTDLSRVERELHEGTQKRFLLRIATECFTAYHWLPPVVAGLA
jgi:DNA-binding transcriptional LysR family regulator